jgi:hypothetical protein
MLLTVKIVLLIAFVVSFLGTVGEKDNNHRNQLAAVCCASALALAAVFIL